MFQRILIANRAAAAARVLRAVRALGREAVVLHSPADSELPYLKDVETVEAPGNRAAESYLNQDFVIESALSHGCDAIHPGYGFLSENADFARRVRAAGLGFIGPSADVIATMGDKMSARRRMADLGLPMVPSSAVLGDDPEANAAAAESLGFPLLVKPAGGGGGIGMVTVRSRDELAPAVERARSVSHRAFSRPDLYLERLVERPRHVEFQVLGDSTGAVAHLFERDCSVQRRYQKVIEEAGAPGLPRDDLDAMARRVADAAAQVGYTTVGTVEMLYHPDIGFSFLEMNTRLQVEHGVTEDVTGIDLVSAQIRLAEGAALSDVMPDRPELTGHAIELRIYAEDPVRFLPSPGRLDRFRIAEAEGVRFETGFAEGCTVTPFYDPMVGKLIARGPDRATCIARLRSVLDRSEIAGIKTNIPLLTRLLSSTDFAAGRVHTDLIPELSDPQPTG